LGTQLTLNISGLHLTENQFSSVPPGSLEVAENVVLDYPSVAQSRRGFQKYLESANSVTQMTEFSGVIHAVSNNLLYRDNAGALSAYSGDVTPPSGTRNRFSEANKALYFTTTQGVKKIFAVGGTIGLAGVEKGMDGFVVSAVDRTFVDGDVNTTDSKITIAGSYYSTGIKTRFTTTGTLPTGLSTGTDYWMRREGTDSFSLYSSLDTAQTGGATGKIVISSASGGGTHTVAIQAQEFLEATKQVAYRSVFGYRDSNEYLFRGSPSGRALAKNSGSATAPVTVEFPIPPSIVAGNFIQIYRTVQSATSPNDELFLVTEITITSAMVSDKKVVFADTLNDVLLGEALYTNASQQGILNSNDEPPFAQDITTYKGMMLYANTRLKQTIYTQLVAVPSVDKTITIGTETYTAKTAEDFSSKYFKVFTSGTRSENIQNTTISLVRAINSASTSYTASYLSVGDPEGSMVIQARTLIITAFVMDSTSKDSFSPVIPTSGITSSSEERQNRFYVSKEQQPDAVPYVRYFEVGDPRKKIIRIIGLRDSAFIFKEDGIFRLVGETYESMRTPVFDKTVVLIGSETAVALNNAIFCFSNQGVLAISDNGVQSIGDPIKFGLQVASKNANFSGNTFGLADQTFGRYILYFPNSSGDTQSTKAFVYSVITNAWVSWTFPASCGMVTDKIYLAGQDPFTEFWINKERNSFALTDFVDHSFNGQIIGLTEDITGDIIELKAADILQIEPGVQIIQGGAKAEVISLLDATHARIKIISEGFIRNHTFVNADIDPILYTISLPSHQLSTGDFFKVSTSGVLPVPLAIDTDYYCIKVDDNYIKLASSPGNAIAGTAIPIENASTGTTTILSGVCDCAKPINVRLAWNPADGGDPSKLKHFQNCNFIFGNSSFSDFIAFFKSSFSPIQEDVEITSDSLSSGWGDDPWGEFIWGDTSNAIQIVKTYIPLEKRRGVWIYAGYSIAQAYSDVQARGVSIVMEETGDYFR